jgi:hypothetical protein
MPLPTNMATLSFTVGRRTLAWLGVRKVWKVWRYQRGNQNDRQCNGQMKKGNKTNNDL